MSVSALVGESLFASMSADAAHYRSIVPMKFRTLELSEESDIINNGEMNRAPVFRDSPG